MARKYEVAVQECGEDCPAFSEDGYSCAVHSCELCEDELPAEMFQEMAGNGERFPSFCPLQEIED
jgi:hypothetical protein